MSMVIWMLLLGAGLAFLVERYRPALTPEGARVRADVFRRRRGW